MNKLTKKSEGSIVIKGIEFVQGKEMEVDTTTFNYIKKTFPLDFTFEQVKLKKEETKLNEKETKRTPTKGRRKKAE